jgi:hypothetical protein
MQEWWKEVGELKLGDRLLEGKFQEPYYDEK